MNISKLFWLLAGLLALAACGEKKIADPIPDDWAKAESECLPNMDKTVLPDGRQGCAKRSSTPKGKAVAP